MALLPCDGCGQRFLGKSVTLYTAFMRNGDRAAFKSRFCFSCGQQQLGRLKELASVEVDGVQQIPTKCPSCKAKLPAEEAGVIYGTAFYQRERLDLCLVVCESCRDKIQPTIEERSERLADRNGGGRHGGAPMPAPSAPAEKALPW